MSSTPSASTTNPPLPIPNPTPTPSRTSPTVLIFDLLTALLDSWTLWSAAAGHDPHLGRLWRSHYLSLTYACGPYTNGGYETLVRRAAALTPNLPSSAADELVRNWTSLEAWDDVPDILWALQKHGYRLGVVTNCSRDLGHEAVRVLEEGVNAARRDRRGGDDVDGAVDGDARKSFRFDAVVTAEEVGWYKPARQAYDACIARMHMTGREAEVLFVAGSSADVPGARGAGMRVVWHNRVGLARVDGGDGEGEGMREERQGRTLRECLVGYEL